MLTTLKMIVGSMVFAVLLDYVWIGKVMARFYKSQIGGILRTSGDSMNPHIPTAILVYVALTCLVVFFVLPLIPEGASYLKVFGYGALFGFLIYCFYDLTNFSVFSVWPLTITLVDIAWGTFLVGATTVVAEFIHRISA